MNKAENQNLTNYNDANLSDWHDYIENESQENTSKIYTLIQVNKPCEVFVTEESQAKLAKIVLG